MTRWLLGLGIAAVFAFVPAQAQVARQRVDKVAAAIEANFYSPEKGKAIADALRRDAAKGQFDALDEPDALAARLTALLRARDRHFRVVPSHGDRDAASAPPRRPRPANFGVGEVQSFGKIGFLELREFAPFDFGRTDEGARKAIDAALGALAGSDAVIIDLRHNGGGAPAMVGYLVSAFTPREATIYNVFHERDGARSEAPDEFYATPRPRVPLYVLISHRTASAAESFAYTLKSAGRATVIGETSAGAANPGEEIDAGDSFRVFVPRGSPVNPITGANWEGVGVQPDVVTDPDQALEVARKLALEVTATPS